MSDSPETDALQKQSAELVVRANTAVISTDEQYQAAGRELVAVVSLKKTIEAAFAAPKKAAHEAHKKILALECSLLKGPASAERIIKAKMLDFKREECLRRQKEAAVVAARMRRDEEDRRIAQAEAVVASGNPEIAERILDAPITVPTIAVQAPQAAGVSARKKYAFRITDEAQINRSFLKVDEVKIRAQVLALGPDAVAIVGGISVFEEESLSVRTAPGRAA